MESQEDIQHQQNRLQTQRKSLAILLNQQARFGMLVPLHIVHGINEARRDIAAIKSSLRTLNIEVADHPDDQEPVERTVRFQPSRRMIVLALTGLIIGCLWLITSAVGLINFNTMRPIRTVGLSIIPTANRCPEGMIFIPAGPFWMGAVPTDSMAEDDEQPGRTVTLSAFCIDRTEVRNADYLEFIEQTNHQPPPPAVPLLADGWVGTEPPPGYANHPVVRITWKDAQAYCRWRNGDLPSEAQWEKAARGDTQTIYPWGDTWDHTLAVAGDGRRTTAEPVESTPAGQSPFGVLNMAGNVAEWVIDGYEEQAYRYLPNTNPILVSQDDTHVIRGGSFIEAPQLLRVSNREERPAAPQNLPATNYIGFRCVQPAP